MKNGKRWVGNTAFAGELPDSSVLLVKFIEFVVIGAIDWLSGTIGGIGEVPDSHRQQSQHRRPDDISSWSQSRIVIGCHRPPNVPRLTKQFEH